jgi:hypothetical protein
MIVISRPHCPGFNFRCETAKLQVMLNLAVPPGQDFPRRHQAAVSITDPAPGN